MLTPKSPYLRAFSMLCGRNFQGENRGCISAEKRFEPSTIKYCQTNTQTLSEFCSKPADLYIKKLSQSFQYKFIGSADFVGIGYECDNEFFRIDYTQYFNYRSGTSWAEILDKDFDTWSDSLMFFLSAWMLDNSFKAKNVTETTTYELSKEQKEVLNEIKKTSKKGEIINIESAENVNNEFKLEANYKPPYKPGTKAVTIKLKESTKFVRVYRESGKLTGGWVMEAEQIESLTPSQIKNKFALEYEPKYICDVKIPAGSTVRYGIANKIVNWGNGGGIQYDLMGQLIGEFTNERLL